MLHLERKNLLHQYGLGNGPGYALRDLKPPLGRREPWGRVTLGEALEGWKAMDIQASSSWPKTPGCGRGHS